MPLPQSIRAGVDQLFAACKFRAADGVTNVAGFYAVGGISGIVRNGAGSYTITLAGGGIDLGSALVTAQCDFTGATNTAECQVGQTNATTIEVRTFSGGVATDKNVWLSVRQVTQ